MAAIEAQEGDRATAAAAKAIRQAGREGGEYLKGCPAMEIKCRISLYNVAIAKWKSEQD